MQPMIHEQSGERFGTEWMNKQSNNLWRIVVIIIFVLLAIWALTLIYYEEFRSVELVVANSTVGMWLTVALKSMGPELAGIVVGVVTIDYLNEKRQDEQVRQQLIMQMGSVHSDVVDTALRAVKARGWLYDGSLSKAVLAGANFTGADLAMAHFRSADLAMANMSGADLWKANLAEALLWDTNFQGAQLTEADLSRANMMGVNLREAWLGGANLSSAKLNYADLRGAGLRSTQLDDADLSETMLQDVVEWTIEQLGCAGRREGTYMPDGKQLKREPLGRKLKIDGPTFDEWKEAYLMVHGGDELTLRNPRPPISGL